MNCSIEIAVEDTARCHLIGIARSVKFELVNAAVLKQVQHGPVKDCIIFWSRQIETISARLKPKLLPVGNPDLLGLAVSAPWRKPHTRCGAE